MPFLPVQQFKEYLKLLQWSYKRLLELYSGMTQVIIYF